MHSTYRSCLFSVVLMLSIAFHANTSEVNYCPCTCSSPPSSYGAPTAALFSPPSLFSNSGSYGAPVAAGNPSPSLPVDSGSYGAPAASQYGGPSSSSHAAPYGRPMSTGTFLSESQHAPNYLGAPATYGASVEHPSQQSAPSFAFAQQEQGPIQVPLPISDLIPVSREQLFQQSQIHSIPGQHPLIGTVSTGPSTGTSFDRSFPTHSTQSQFSVGVFKYLEKLNERLLTPTFVKKNSAIMPAGYLITLAATLHLFNDGTDETKTKLRSLLGMEEGPLPEQLLRDVISTLHNFPIEFKHQYVDLSGKGNTGNAARTFFQNMGIQVFDTEAAVKYQLPVYTAYGHNQVVDSENNGKLVMNLVERFDFTWLHPFQRPTVTRAFHSEEGVTTQVSFVETKSVFRAHKKSGEWKAVEVPLLRHGVLRPAALEAALLLAKPLDLANMPAFAAVQHESLAVYLIGPDGKGEIPNLSTGLLKEVNSQLEAATALPNEVAFPAFHLRAGTLVNPAGLPELPWEDSAGKFSSVGENVKFVPKQGLYLCADEFGLDTRSRSSGKDSQSTISVSSKYVFDSPFHVVLVHRPTGEALVVAHVAEAMGGAQKCRV